MSGGLTINKINMVEQVFLSYARVDGGAFAARLAQDLRKQTTCRVWIDQTGIQPGQFWDSEIVRPSNGPMYSRWCSQKDPSVRRVCVWMRSCAPWTKASGC